MQLRQLVAELEGLGLVRVIVRQIAALALVCSATGCGAPPDILNDFFKKDGVAAVVGRLPIDTAERKLFYRAGFINLIQVNHVTDERVLSAVAAFEANNPHPLATILDDSNVRRRTRIGKPNDHGRFEFIGVAPGRYYVLAIIPFCETTGSDCQTATAKDIMLREIQKKKSEDLFVDFRH